MLSGECIKACHYGVNPRFLLAVARVKMAKAAGNAVEQRRRGVETFRKVTLTGTPRMPGWQYTLQSPEIDAIIAYLNTLTYQSTTKRYIQNSTKVAKK